MYSTESVDGGKEEYPRRMIKIVTGLQEPKILRQALELSPFSNIFGDTIFVDINRCCK